MQFVLLLFTIHYLPFTIHDLLHLVDKKTFLHVH